MAGEREPHREGGTIKLLGRFAEGFELLGRSDAQETWSSTHPKQLIVDGQAMVFTSGHLVDHPRLILLCLMVTHSSSHALRRQKRGHAPPHVATLTHCSTPI